VLASLTWDVSRSSGVIAYVLLSASVIVGLTMSTRLSSGRPSLPWLLDVHRMLSGVGVTLVGVHIVSILADTFVGFSLVDVLVPFSSGWRPAGVAAGIVAMYLLVAVEVSSLLRNRLAKRTWRRIHFLSFVLFLLTSVHFLAAGTDSGGRLSVFLLVSSVGTVLALTAYRISLANRSPVAAAASPRAPRPPASRPASRTAPRSAPQPAPPPVARRAGVAPPPPPPPRRRGAPTRLDQQGRRT
jgi:predicted ferric reductase